MEQLDCKSDSSDSSDIFDEQENVTSAAGNAAYIPGASLSDKLRLAASKGQTDRLKSLVSLGAVFEPDREGRTALHYAAVNGFAETVSCLVELGSNLDARDKLGYTAVHRAAAQGHTEVIEVLTERGCWIDSQDEMNGNTALHEAAWNGYSKTLQILITNGADVQTNNKTGFSALHMAAQNGHNQCARLLLYAGCNPLNKNNYGDTALHTAARYGHAGITRILISARCNINDQNKNADTALHIAAALKRRKITKLLVEAGIMTNILNRQSETALEVAQRKGHTEIAQMLLASQPKLKVQSVEMNWNMENGKPIPALPTPVAAVEMPPPPTATDDDGRKKKKGFFFMKKKKPKERDHSGDSGGLDPTPPSIRLDPTPPSIPPGFVPSRMTAAVTSNFPHPDELIQGFQQHQAKKFQTGWPAAQPGFHPGGHYEPARIGTQYYMDLAGNIIREGPVNSATNFAYPLDRPSAAYMLSNEMDAANRCHVQQVAAGDAERRCFDRNFHFDEMATLEQRVRKQFNMQRGLVSNAQPMMRGHDHHLHAVPSSCKCDWCHSRTTGRPHRHRDDVANRHHSKHPPATPPPGKMYKSKSDETLSTISSHAHQQQQCPLGAREQDCADVAKSRLSHRRGAKDKHEKRQEGYKKMPVNRGQDGRSVRAKTPEVYLEGGELHNDNAVVVPANVREWLIKQNGRENTGKSAIANKCKYSEVYDL